MFIFFFSRTWTYIFTSARRIVHDTMLHFTLSTASAFFFFVPFSYAAAGFIAVSQFSSQTQRNISINDAVLESSSSFASCVFYFFCFVIIVIFAVSPLVVRLRLSCGSSCWNFGFPVLKSSFDYSLSLLFTSSYSLFTTAHSRCDEFFVCHFCISSSTSSSTSWYLLNLRDPSCHVFTTICPLTVTSLAIQFREIRSRGTHLERTLAPAARSTPLNVSDAAFNPIIASTSGRAFETTTAPRTCSNSPQCWKSCQSHAIVICRRSRLQPPRTS